MFIQLRGYFCFFFKWKIANSPGKHFGPLFGLANNDNSFSLPPVIFDRLQVPPPPEGCLMCAISVFIDTAYMRQAACGCVAHA